MMEPPQAKYQNGCTYCNLKVETTNGVKYVKKCKVEHYKKMKEWWETNVSKTNDDATFVNSEVRRRVLHSVGDHGGGQSRLASNNYDTLHRLYGLPDCQDIIPTKAAWNEGATIHLINKPNSEKFNDHGGAGGDEEFNAFFNDMASALGSSSAKTSAGGDENLEDRVAALEAKLVTLENSKAGGGKSCFDCCKHHISGNNPSGAADGADEAALTKAKKDNTDLLGKCYSACNGSKETWKSKLNILECCHGNTNGQC